MSEIRPPILTRPAPAATGLAACQVRFSAGSAEGATAYEPALHVATPVLAGPAGEVLLEYGAVSSSDGCTVFRAGDAMAGFAAAAPLAPLEDATRELYDRVFRATAGLRLGRIWNYVPRINAIDDGLENYRRFCRGRSVAFEKQFGADFRRALPAGSAVGLETGPVAVAFFATEKAPQHFENPRQVPAFEYPLDYGPRPPNFARATLVTTGEQRKVFISGTAAIRGHRSISPHELSGQLPCMLENLTLIAETAGAGTEVGAAHAWHRAFKVYLRHARDLPAVQACLERELVRKDDSVTYLLADLCRADLNVEIEAVLTK
ncbi:MAG: hypothetical protein Q7S40_05290 [Opitutaceae bacterium]|nr:hypothetical protein [Opitutaceae bacterium]